MRKLIYQYFVLFANEYIFAMSSKKKDASNIKN